MNVCTLILLSASLAAPQSTSQQTQFESYTKAYLTASEAHKPMLVVLNPSTEKAVSIDELRADPKLALLLDEYVVAVVDCESAHGKQVHKAFGSKPLPYIAVIDEQQDKQVFKTSKELTHTQFETILAKYKDGAKAAALADQIRLQNDCPLCRRNQTSF